MYIISAVASPFFGFCIDKTGKNIFWVILGTIVTLGCHALLAFTFITPFVAMVSMCTLYTFNPIALRKIEIVCNFGLYECNRVNSAPDKKV